MYTRTATDDKKDAAKVLITSVGRTSRTIRCQHGFVPTSFRMQYNETTFEVTDAQYYLIITQIGDDMIACDF